MIMDIIHSCGRWRDQLCVPYFMNTFYTWIHMHIYNLQSTQHNVANFWTFDRQSLKERFKQKFLMNLSLTPFVLHVLPIQILSVKIGEQNTKANMWDKKQIIRALHTTKHQQLIRCRKTTEWHYETVADKARISAQKHFTSYLLIACVLWETAVAEGHVCKSLGPTSLK